MCRVVPDGATPGLVLLDASDWQPADVLLFGAANGGWVSRQIALAQEQVFASDAAAWSHAALHVGDGLLVEAVARDPGTVVASSIVDHPGAERAVVRLYCAELNDEDRGRIVEEAYGLVGVPYGRRTAVELGLRLWFDIPEVMRAAAASPGQEEAVRSALVCSEVILRAYIGGAGITPAPHTLHPRVPAALASSPRFTHRPVSHCRVADALRPG